MPRRRDGRDRVSDAERVDLLRELHAAQELALTAQAAVAAAMWRAALLCYEQGIQVEDICHATGVSEATFRRHLRELRGGNGHD